MALHLTRRTWIAAGAGLCLASAGGFYAWRKREDAAFLAEKTPRTRAIFGGDEGAEVLLRPDAVKAWTIKHKSETEYRYGLDDMEATSPAVAVPPEAAAALAQHLLSPFTYSWNWMKPACGPRFGVRLSFFRGGRGVHVFFCFGCAILMVFLDDAKHSYLGGNFNYGDHLLAAEMKKLFPGDAEVQSLRTTARRRPWNEEERPPYLPKG